MTSLHLIKRDKYINGNFEFYLLFSVLHLWKVALYWDFILKFGIFCNLNLYYRLIRWFYTIVASIFLYYWTCQKYISQHELYSPEKLRTGIAWSIAGKCSFEREIEQKMFYFLNKVPDLIYEKKKRKFSLLHTI